MNEIAFMGLFAVLWMTMTYIYIISKKMTALMNRIEVIEHSVDSGNVEMIGKLMKIKRTIEEKPETSSPMINLENFKSSEQSNKAASYL